MYHFVVLLQVSKVRAVADWSPARNGLIRRVIVRVQGGRQLKNPLCGLLNVDAMQVTWAKKLMLQRACGAKVQSSYAKQNAPLGQKLHWSTAKFKRW